MPANVQLRRMEPSNKERGLWDVWFTTLLKETTYAEAVVASMHLSKEVASSWHYSIEPAGEEGLRGVVQLSWLSGLLWTSFELVRADATEVPPPLIRDTAIPEQEAYTIWIEAELWEPGTWASDDDFCNILVTFANGVRWAAGFITYKNLESLRKEQAQTGENLGGRYFCMPETVLVDELTRSTIEAVVADMLREGSFTRVFEMADEKEDGIDE